MMEQACVRRSSPPEALGIMPENAKLTPWPKSCRMDSLGLLEKSSSSSKADVYGAYLATPTNEIVGSSSVEDLGELSNTLIIYIGGDNGASAEGMINGTPMSSRPSWRPGAGEAQYLWYPFGARTRPSRILPRRGRGRWTPHSSG